jgi:hypothetical protein
MKSTRAEENAFLQWRETFFEPAERKPMLTNANGYELIGICVIGRMLDDPAFCREVMRKVRLPDGFLPKISNATAPPPKQKS